MSTVFPEQIQTFPTMKDLTASDVVIVKNYQSAMEAGNFALANQYLSQLTEGSSKIINANYMNTISDTIVALQNYYLQKWSPAYVVSSSQPATQSVGDYWIKIV